MLKFRGLSFPVVAELLGWTILIPVVQVGIGLALGSHQNSPAETGIAAMWISLFVNATLVIPLLLREDLEDRAYELYILAGKLDLYFWERVITGTFILWFLGGISLLSAVMLYQLPLGPLGIQEILALGAFGLGHSALTFLIHWMTLRVRGGSGLISLLGYPLYLPLTLAGVGIYRESLGFSQESHPWFLLLLFLVLLYSFFGSLLCPILLKE